MCRKKEQQVRIRRSDSALTTTQKTNDKKGENGQIATRRYPRRLKLLIQEKAAADKKKVSESAVSVTRTVELQSTEAPGVESSKLLFMLAIGLTPKPVQNGGQEGPSVHLHRLDPVILDQAKVKTKQRILEVCKQRNLIVGHQIQNGASSPSHPGHSTSSNSKLGPESIDEVRGQAEYIDLVSSESEDDEEVVEIKETSSIITEAFRSELHKPLGHGQIFGGFSKNYLETTWLSGRKSNMTEMLKNPVSEIIRKLKRKQTDAEIAEPQSNANVGDSDEYRCTGDSSSSSGFSELESVRYDDNEVIILD